MAGNFHRRVGNKISGQLLVAEIFQHPVENLRNFGIAQCRLRSAGNPDQELPSTRYLQEAAYFIFKCRDLPRRAGAISQVASLALQDVIDAW